MLSWCVCLRALFAINFKSSHLFVSKSSCNMYYVHLNVEKTFFQWFCCFFAVLLQLNQIVLIVLLFGSRSKSNQRFAFGTFFDFEKIELMNVVFKLQKIWASFHCLNFIFNHFFCIERFKFNRNKKWSIKFQLNVFIVVRIQIYRFNCLLA